MKQMFFMRVLFCNIPCPSFICFCKPSLHIYSSGPLKLENIQHVPPTLVTVSDAYDHTIDGPLHKSCLRKVTSEAKEVPKKSIQWLDFLGKQLVEIREFESSEREDTDNEGHENRACVCVIL